MMVTDISSYIDVTYITMVIFGPGVLACGTRGGRRREAGHCFHLLFWVQTCLRAPPVVAHEAKLAIVFTYFLKGLPRHKVQVQSKSLAKVFH